MLNLGTMNIVLLAKWWFRFNDPGTSCRWKEILIAKYGLQGSSYRMSVFWSSVIKYRAMVNLGFKKVLGNGQSISFWTDIWLGECAFSSLYPNLYNITVDSSISVPKVIVGGSFGI